MIRYLAILLLMSVSVSASQWNLDDLAHHANLNHTMIAADSASTSPISECDTFIVDISGPAFAGASFFWRSYNYHFDSLFTGSAFHVITRHGPTPTGPWVAWDSTKAVLTADSMSGNGASNYAVNAVFLGRYRNWAAARILSDSDYVGTYLQIRVKSEQTAPTTTVFKGISGRLYRARVDYWLEPRYGNE